MIALSDKRFIFMHGPRKTTKSNTAQNMVLMHAHYFDGAMIGIFVKGLKGAVGSGVWHQLTDPRDGLIAQWARDPDGVQLQYETPPTMKSDTKMRWFRIYNRHGGVSEVQLHTIVSERDIESLLKDQQFSMAYIVEADRFESPDIFKRLVEQLRGTPRIPHQFRRIIVDSNPAKEGTDHWLYWTFIKDKDGNYIPDIDPRIAEFGFTMDDNPFIPDEEKQEIYLNNKSDPVDLARLYYGQWIKDTRGTIFKEQFRPSFHIVGGERGEVLLPGNECYELPCGFDLGDASNHAAVIAAKRYGPKGQPIYDVIDELVIINQNYSLETLTYEFIEKMKRWEEHMRPDKITPIFRFWSDSSSTRYLAVANGSEANAIYTWSEGKIVLRGVRKGAGSVGRRIQLLKRILAEDRIFVSNSCPHVKDMLEHIKTNEKGVIPENSPYKHAFDALTYMIGYEEPRVSNDHDHNRPKVGTISV